MICTIETCSPGAPASSAGGLAPTSAPGPARSERDVLAAARVLAVKNVLRHVAEPGRLRDGPLRGGRALTRRLPGVAVVGGDLALHAARERLEVVSLDRVLHGKAAERVDELDL